MLHRAQSLERRERGIAGGLKGVLDIGEFIWPIGEPYQDILQRLIRRPRGLHHATEVRRVEMARDKAERFKRLQQGRQHGHDVVHHGLAHGSLPWLAAFSAASAVNFSAVLF